MKYYVMYRAPPPPKLSYGCTLWLRRCLERLRVSAPGRARVPSRRRSLNQPLARFVSCRDLTHERTGCLHAGAVGAAWWIARMQAIQSEHNSPWSECTPPHPFHISPIANHKAARNFFRKAPG